MNKYYIRIGELPRDNKSKIYQWDNKEHTSRSVVGEEKGISAYNAVFDEEKGNWLISPHASRTASYRDTLLTLIEEVVKGEKSVYLITGNEIGIGYDGEPLLEDVKVVKDITYQGE